MTGYPSVFGITATAPQRIPARSTSSSKQRDTCTSATFWRDQFIDKLAKYLKDATTAADLRCTIIEGIQQWFTTVDTNESDEPDTSTQLSWFQIIKGYIPNQWSITRAKFSRDQGLDSRYNSGERWTSQLITFFWTQGRTLWKDRYTSAHAPDADSLVKSSARNRQTAQNVTTMAYASSPLMLAIDRRIFHIPLDERLRARTSDLEAWNKTMLPTIRLSISEAQNQILTGHEDIRTFLPIKAAPV
jgi:hypothetical protein